jgi:hypothetical protein
MSKKTSWGGGFKQTVVSKPGSTLTVAKVQIPKTVREAISDGLQTAKKASK